MSVKGINNLGNMFNHPQPEPPKPKPQAVQPQIQEGKDSKIGANNFQGNMLRFRLQNMAATGASTAQPVGFQQTPPTTPPNPYDGKTADQIASEQKAKYENASDKQQAAEEAGRTIADIAKYDPAKALEVSRQILGDRDKYNEGGILRGKDKDELA